MAFLNICTFFQHNIITAQSYSHFFFVFSGVTAIHQDPDGAEIDYQEYQSQDEQNMLVDFENLQTKIDGTDDSVDAINLNIDDETTADFDEQAQTMVKSSIKCKICKGFMKRVLKSIGKEKNKVRKFHFNLPFLRFLFFLKYSL